MQKPFFKPPAFRGLTFFPRKYSSKSCWHFMSHPLIAYAERVAERWGEKRERGRVREKKKGPFYLFLVLQVFLIEKHETTLFMAISAMTSKEKEKKASTRLTDILHTAPEPIIFSFLLQNVPLNFWRRYTMQHFLFVAWSVRGRSIKISPISCMPSWVSGRIGVNGWSGLCWARTKWIF